MWTKKADRQARKQAAPATQASSPNVSATELVIRLKERHLRWTSLDEAVNYIIDNGLREYSVIRFDFSRVTELVGPWGIHFAILIRLEHLIGVPVTVSGLTGQPADMARLFRSSPKVRALLSRQESDRQAA